MAHEGEVDFAGERRGKHLLDLRHDLGATLLGAVRGFHPLLDKLVVPVEGALVCGLDHREDALAFAAAKLSLS